VISPQLEKYAFKSASVVEYERLPIQTPGAFLTSFADFSVFGFFAGRSPDASPFTASPSFASFSSLSSSSSWSLSSLTSSPL
jgi:hypothetical protein